ncbi:sensor histidine kinase, partial [Streptomyces sp. SID5926]|nr:sensor histidine kinase [Streptomyces sp. SID5926]
AAYRIVQEALTNAARHAGPANVRVRIDYGTRNTTDPAVDHTTDHTGDRMGELTIVVDDDGAADPDRPPVPGTGLTGMHERVSALGGTLRAAPRAEGGFSVRARLPLGEAA